MPAHLITADDINNTPASVDWRTAGAVSAVKDQGRCGSCWAFSTTGSVESQWFINHKVMQNISEQQLVSCESDCDGCGGGWPYKAMDFMAENTTKISTEASYPYTSGTDGSDPACKAKGGLVPAVAQVTGYFAVNQSEEVIAAFVSKYGPVSIGVDVRLSVFFSLCVCCVCV